jgi:hypothetical protein
MHTRTPVVSSCGTEQRRRPPCMLSSTADRLCAAVHRGRLICTAHDCSTHAYPSDTLQGHMRPAHLTSASTAAETRPQTRATANNTTPSVTCNKDKSSCTETNTKGRSASKVLQIIRWGQSLAHPIKRESPHGLLSQAASKLAQSYNTDPQDYSSTNHAIAARGIQNITNPCLVRRVFNEAPFAFVAQGSCRGQLRPPNCGHTVVLQLRCNRKWLMQHRYSTVPTYLIKPCKMSCDPSQTAADKLSDS